MLHANENILKIFSSGGIFALLAYQMVPLKVALMLVCSSPTLRVVFRGPP